MKTNIEIMTQELHKAFKLINARFFENKIPLPAITIQSSGKRSLSMGWCTLREVWHDKKGEQKLYEINLSAEYINVSFLETMDTLMHEMVHLYNNVHNVKDVSRNGTYHNKRFLERALQSGFHYPDKVPHKSYGFSNIRLTDETKTILESMGLRQEVFSIARKPPSEMIDDISDADGDGQKRNKTSFKWICPSCDLIIRSSKREINVICGDCQEQLEYVDE